ncbi:hypothetical protein D3C78_1078170 [compost metagenome]
MVEYCDVLVADIDQQVVTGALEIQRGQLAVVPGDPDRIVVTTRIGDRIDPAARGAEVIIVVTRRAGECGVVVQPLDGHLYRLRIAAVE